MNLSSESLVGQTVWLPHAGERCLLRELIDFAESRLSYRAERADGSEAIVHWYPETAAESDFGQEISRRIFAGSPDPAWLWPVDLALHQAEPGFGLVLPAGPATFQPLPPLLAFGPSGGLSLTARLQAGGAICRAIEALHGCELRLGDFTPQLILCHPATGEVRLDGAGILKADEGQWLGTPRYLAPELLGGASPNGFAADGYTLGLLLFELLTGQHPLEGASLAAIGSFDLPAMRRLYGSEARFIFEPAGSDLMPEAQASALPLTRLWQSLPGKLRETFTQLFTAGLTDPAARPGAAEWIPRLRSLLDRLYPCVVCGKENVLADRDSKPRAAAPGSCWSCDEPLPTPFGLELGSDLLALYLGRKVAASRLGATTSGENPGAEVVSHPRQVGSLGLRNHTAEPWKARHTLAEAEAVVGPGQAVRLEPGLRIRFHSTLEAQVR